MTFLSAAPTRAPRRCSYCGGPAQVVDHIWPRSRGGINHPNNLTPACRDCNSGKGSKSLLTDQCRGCGSMRDPGDVDSATGDAFYACRCGVNWVTWWDLQRVTRSLGEDYL